MGALFATLFLGANAEHPLRKSLAVLFALLACLALYLWLMGRLDYNAVAEAIFRHQAGSAQGTGLPIYEGLVHATPWRMTFCALIAGAALLQCGDEFKGLSFFGMSLCLLNTPYLVAKILAEIFHVDVFRLI